MKRLIITILMITGMSSFLVSTVHAHDVVVIKTSDIKPYNETFRGFKSVCSAGTREFEPRDLDNPEVIRNINRNRPSLVLAIGVKALSRAKRIKDVPIVYAMVSNPGAAFSGERNITGVSMNISARMQLEALLKIVPDTKKIGLVYNPENTGYLFKEARRAAGELGVSIIPEEVYVSRDVPSAINSLAGRIDSFWLLPDTTVITPASLDYLLLFSYENSVPVLAFSDKYVEEGFFMSLSMDAGDVGAQAGEMANKILGGKDVNTIPPVPPRKAELFLNLKAAEKLGISLEPGTVQKNGIRRGVYEGAEPEIGLSK